MTAKKTTTQQAISSRQASQPKRSAKKTATAKSTVKRAPVKKSSAQKSVKPMSALDAAAKVLTEAQQPMTSQALIEAMANKGFWASPSGRTPQSTLYAAMIREIAKKGNASRFKKTGRGRFAANT